MKIDKLVAVENDNRIFPLGITRIKGGLHISVAVQAEHCSLVLYETEDPAKKRVIPFPAEFRLGDVWSIDLMAESFEGIEYCLEVDGKEISDIHGRSFEGRNEWGDLEAVDRLLHSRFEMDGFDWEGDRRPQIPYEESVIYRLHVRGFTMHPSSHVSDKGTFRAVGKKIPYLKELGVTAVELMPANEFCEVMMPDGSDGNPYHTDVPSGRLNYWGYAPGYYFAPKASYASGKGKDPVREFKELVKMFHENGMEIIIELYFTGKESHSLVQDAVRFWVQEYHVDGVHLSGFANTGLLADDPYLSAAKLFANGWNPERGNGKRHLGEYNDAFQTDMRRALKGDENQMNNLIFRSRRNPGELGVINYMANTNGFTMMDMVCYERKHNEANGESNRDGSDFNFTWNCGVEGPTKRKKVVEMRRKQLRNAFLLLFLSQGTPLLLSGDEFGATKKGNNNTYCQDNELSWLNWNLLNSQADIYSFVKYVIAFRKSHPVFHMEMEPRIMDYLACGHPDVSYHGEKAWCPEFENFRRQIGIMYCGEYGRKADGTADDYFFVAYNMHWEPHEFSLPYLPKGMQWHVNINTDEKEQNGIYPEGEEPLLKQQKQFLVPARSIVVFIGLKGEENGSEKAKETARKGARGKTVQRGKKSGTEKTEQSAEENREDNALNSMKENDGNKA